MENGDQKINKEAMLYNNFILYHIVCSWADIPWKISVLVADRKFKRICLNDGAVVDGRILYMW